MNVTLEEVIQEFQRQFPKEFTICLQAVQIAKLQQQAAVAEEAPPVEGD